MIAFPDYPFHEVVSLFPPMTTAEFNDLKEDLKATKQRVPILLLQGRIIDGRSRYKALRELGMFPVVKEWDGDESELVEFVVSINLKRRHLDESQRAVVARRLINMKIGDNQHKRTNGEGVQICTPSIGRDKAAKMLNVSPRLVSDAGKIEEKAIPELQKIVEAGQASVSAAVEVSRLPAAEQQAVVAEGPKAIIKKAAEIRGDRKAEQVNARRTPIREAIGPADEAGEIEEGERIILKYTNIVSDAERALAGLAIDEIKALAHTFQASHRKLAIKQLKSLVSTLTRWINALETRHA